MKFGNFASLLNSSKIYNTGALHQLTVDLENGVDRGTAYANNMIGMSRSTKEAAAEILNLNKQLKDGTITKEQYDLKTKAIINDTEKFTFAQKAATVATKVLGTALNMAVNIALSYVIGQLANEVFKYINAAEEAAQKAKDSATNYEQQKKSMEGLIKEYENILNSDKTSIEKTQELNEWKNNLIETYGFEREALKNLNTQREEGVELLQQEIDKNNEAARTKWRGENGEAISNAQREINGTRQIVQLEGFGALGGLDNSILGMFKQQVTGVGTELYFEGNLIEQYEQLLKVIEKLQNRKELLQDVFSQAEQALLDDLQQRQEEWKEVLDDYQEIYEKNLQVDFDEIVSNYTKTDAGKLENVGKDTYLSWKQGLIAEANGDTDLEKMLTDYAEKQFSAYNDYFKNLDIVKANINKNSISVADFVNMNDWIDSLDESDLDILANKIEEPFKNGLEGAKQLLADFKADPDNTVSMSFDYATYSEQVDNVIKNTNTLKKAIDTLTESGSLEADTIAELAKTFPAYSSQILAAQGNSEQLKNVLITAMNAEPSSLIETLRGLKGLTAEEQQEVDGLINILETLSKTTTNTAVSFKDWSEILKDVSDKESILDSIHKELDKDGHISISTYQKLIEAGSDYADLVTIENGQLKISEQKYKDLVVQKYKDQVATIELAKAEKIRELAVKSSIGATQEEIQAIRDEITALAQASEAAKGNVDKALELWSNYDPDDGSSGGGSSKSQYSNELQLLKDQLNDRVITYEQFLQQWQALNDKYHNMSEEDGGISDYEWGQNNRDIIAERTKAYEQEKAQLKELYEAGSITLEQYNAQLNTSLNHWLGGYTQLSSEYEKEVKSNTKELSEYRKKEYDDEIKDLKELYENGEITLEQLNSKMSESANHWLGGIAGLSDEFKDAVNDNYDYIKTHFFDKIDRSLDELEDEYERTGDISLLDKRETTINNAISQADTELSELYAKGLTEDNDDVQFWLEKQKKYNKDLESVLDERVDIVKDNVQETIETFDDEYEKSGDTAIFDKQISVYLQGQSDILNLIERYKDLGYSEESDAIKSLRKQYEEYGESIINVYDKITNAITDSVDKQIEAIEEKFEKTGDVNTFNDKISAYQSGKTAVQTQIDNLISKGYSENSEELQKLVKQLADYDKEIIGVYSEITNYIETQTDNQLKSIDELVALTGDTSALYRKIDILNNGKLGIEGQIAKLLDEGYSESSEEVKSLYDKIKEYDNNILDVYSDIANRIDKETDKQLEIIDREIEKSGDTRQYQVRLNILADYKGQIQALIDELLKLGYDANSEIVQDLLSKIDSIDDDIRETSKDRIDAQVDAYEEVMSLESDQLEKYKDEQDKIFDEKIKALEDQKKALEDQSEEIEKQNELQEKQKNILDAQRGVMKSIRMIYSGNGQWTVSPTQESLENLKDAEKELEATQRKQQIEAIDKLIDGIEEQKKTFDDAIDEQTKAIQDGVDAFEKAMTVSYKVYAQLDYTLLKSILGEKDALKYYSDYNDVLAKNGVIDATMTTAKVELDDAVESLEEQSEANVKFTESTEQATKAVDTFAKKMQDEFGLGNVDLTTRPFVSGHKMRKAGYDVDPNGTSTVLSSVEYLWQGDEENGRYVGVHYTPILPNGEVLTDQELADYLHEVLEGSDDILKADNKGIILKIDDDLNLSEKDIRSLESNKLTKNMKTVLDAADAWDEALHNAQEKWMELWFAEYGNPNDSISAKAENIIDLFGNKVYGGILGKIQQILTNGSIGSLLPISSEALNQFTPKTASDQSNIVNSNIFNPVITNNITVNASSGNANDIRDAVKDVVDNRIIAGLKAFADGYNQSALNTMYGR